MPAALIIAVAASTAISAYEQHKAGQAQKQAAAAQNAAADSQAQLDDYNASVADLQAKDAIAQGADAESRLRTQIRGTIGTQRAETAANSVDVGFGSAVDVQADAAYLGELDVQQARLNAKRQAWGFQVQAFDLRKQGEITRKAGAADLAAGDQAAKAANLQAVGTIANGATTLLAQRYGFKNGNA
jgi:hypothetical protein